jgi:cytochrome oxidase Cu insertion factor (SCO1/SenC/PrrC family)
MNPTTTPTAPAWTGAAPFDARQHALERARFQRRHLPDVPLITHTAQPVQFYRDLVRDRQVVVGVTYSTCQNYCVPVARNLLQARLALGELGARLRIVLLTLTPLQDRPPDLQRFMREQGLAEGWTLATGTPDDVETLAMALGLLSRNPAERDLRQHATRVRIGDEPRVRWGHAGALGPVPVLARMIRFELA